MQTRVSSECYIAQLTGSELAVPIRSSKRHLFRLGSSLVARENPNRDKRVRPIRLLLEIFELPPPYFDIARMFRHLPLFRG